MKILADAPPPSVYNQTQDVSSVDRSSELMEPNSSYTQLRNLIAEHFNRTELEFLSYDLTIDFEEIAGPDTPLSKIITISYALSPKMNDNLI